MVVTRGGVPADVPVRGDRAPRNRYEIALWAVAAVLIVGSLLLELLSWSTVMSGVGSDCDADGNCSTPFIAQLAQVAFSVMPNVLEAGIFVAAIAIAIRAVDINARRRAEAVAIVDGATQPAPAQHQSATASYPAGPTAVLPRAEPPVRAPAQPDHAIFMRPPARD
ncbi:hypothetical protein [Glaciihabitans sp. dw_435]|uniref:hypothetical protein n=1 Tax=Glaciihabitans sp. dw_435 TaxID=2720081 RepID=UPI001BD45950|nr:hypothetical protein [Glaciihabitans sp. dw_435]